MSHRKLYFVLFASSALILSWVALKYAYFEQRKKQKKQVPQHDECLRGNQTDEHQTHADGELSLHQSGQQNNKDLIEASALTLQLNTSDAVLLEKTLVTITNYAAFKHNQDLLREAGCLTKLKGLIEKYRMAMKLGGGIPHQGVVNRLASTLNNLAMNAENQQQLQGCIPALIDFASCDQSSGLQLASLQALTNLSVTSQYHTPYTQLIQQLYDLLDTGSHSHSLQALKILVNLSCNSDMVPHLLAARAPKCSLELLSPNSSTPHLLRWTTILANIIGISEDQGITSTTLPCEYKAASPETLHAVLYGVDNHSRVKSKVFLLCKHEDEDVRIQATKVHGFLS